MTYRPALARVRGDACGCVCLHAILILGYPSDLCLSRAGGFVPSDRVLLSGFFVDFHRILAAVNLAAHHDYEKAFYHQKRALGLNPNDDLIVVQHGEILTWLGRPEEGI